MCASELDRSNESDELREPELTFLLEERTSPFIDEGDGFTSEREIVRMLLSLVAHAWRVHDDGRHPQHYCMLDARGRLRRFVRVWQISVPAILLMPRGM